MFKIYDDKVYFVAETPDINKVVEIFLPKDDRGTIMDSHEIRVDLCRAIRKLQHDGYTIMKVYPAMGDRRESIDVLSWTISRRMKANDSWKSTVVAGTGAMSMTFPARSS